MPLIQYKEILAFTSNYFFKVNQELHFFKAIWDFYFIFLANNDIMPAAAIKKPFCFFCKTLKINIYIYTIMDEIKNV